MKNSKQEISPSQQQGEGVTQGKTEGVLQIENKVSFE